MELTLASYSNNLLNLIIRPAGRSRSFKWLGRGNINNIPYVPRPIFIPRWIPRERPEYVAKWVPTTPGPQSNKQSPQQPGFGPPKTNSVVQSQKLPAAYEVAPAKDAAPPPPPVPAHAPAPVKTPAVEPSSYALPPPPVPAHVPAPVQTPAVQPSGYAPPHADDIYALPPPPVPAHVPASVRTPAVQLSGYAPPHADDIYALPPPPVPAHVPAPVQTPAVQPFGYAPPYADDIILPYNGPPATVATEPILPGPIIIEQPLPQPDWIPETAIRNTFTNSALEVPGEPSFSALIQDKAVVDLGDFHQVNPHSVITIDQGNLETTDNAFNIGSNIIVADEPENNFNQAELFTVTGLTEPNSFLLTDFNDGIQTDYIIDDSSSTDEGNDLLFVVNSDSTLNPLTTPRFFKEEENIQFLQDNDGKSFDTPIISQILDPIQSNLVSDQNLGTLFHEDLTTHISQSNVVTKLNEDIKPDDTFLITQDTQINDFQPNQNFQSNENPLVTGGFQFNQDIQPNETPQFIVESELSTESFDDTFSSQQGLEPQQNIQSNENNEFFLINTDTIQTVAESQPDQVAQFSNFQLGQRINFRPLPIQQHDTTGGSLIPSLPRPALVAPPVSPIIASERSFSTDHRFDTYGPVAPSGRSISTDIAIPLPVPIPIGPLASVTLDFPKEGPGVRQARVASDLLPFGAHIHPRPARRYQSRRFVFGK